MTDRIAFQDAMEGEDGILVHIASSIVTVQTEVRPGRYFRFGPSNPIVRLKAMTPDAMSRVYTFELSDGTEVPHPVRDILDRMSRKGLEAIRPVIWPIPRMHETLMTILAHGASCLAATIEGDVALRRPNRAAIARNGARARAVIDVLTKSQPDRAGIATLEQAITGQIAFELESMRLLEAKAGPVSKLKRHREIAASLENARTSLSSPARTDVDRAHRRLAEAAVAAAAVPPARTRAA